MKKIAKLILVCFMGTPLFAVADERPSDFQKIETNFNNIRTLSVRVESSIINQKGRADTRGRILMDGRNRRRFDHLTPERSVYIINRDTYVNYDFSEKKEVRKKLTELSPAHIIFLEEFFLDIIHDPVNLLMRRYSFPAFRKGYRDLTSPLTGVSLRDPAARIAVHFNAEGITSIDYFYRGNLNKRTVFSEFVTIKGVSVPTSMKTTVFVKPSVYINVKLSEISINDEIDDRFFRKINP
ncbi:MAG: hypothetical protein MUC76_01190 [Spirochaetes bacterium]|nr:hypothetical protein [Spirochaetota bacterium]